jgi:hypothetical protein
MPFKSPSFSTTSLKSSNASDPDNNTENSYSRLKNIEIAEEN